MPPIPGLLLLLPSRPPTPPPLPASYSSSPRASYSSSPRASPHLPLLPHDCAPCFARLNNRFPQTLSAISNNCLTRPVNNRASSSSTTKSSL
jgi:hypothetical protein